MFLCFKNIYVARAIPIGTETDNYQGKTRPLRSSNPNVNLFPPRLLTHMLKCPIQTFRKHIQRHDSITFLGSLFSVPHHSEQFSITSHLNLLWHNLKPPSLILLLLPGEEAKPHLTTTSFQITVRVVRSPLSHLFSRLHHPSSLSHSS